MRYLPILGELFESDTVVFLIIGAGLGFLLGFLFKNSKSRIRAVISFAAVYAVCEGIANIHTNFLVEFILLFVGTAALGAIAGVILNIPVYKFLSKLG